MRRAALLTALVVALVGLALPAHAEEEPIPVNYNFLENSVMYGALPHAPGSNEWDCEPSAAHPRPVVLVHGTAGSAGGNWGTASAVLANRGYCVFALTYGVAPEMAALPVSFGGMNRLQDSVEQLSAFVDKVLRRTGSSKVDLVGHSQGTILSGFYVKSRGGAHHVRNVVSLASAWHGAGALPIGQLATYGAAYGFDASDLFPVFKAGPQMVNGSAFMTRLADGGFTADGVRYTNIVTQYDEVVFPYTQGVADGMRNIVLQDHCAEDFSEHVQIPSSPNALRLVLNALTPSSAKPVDCRLVLPLNGFVQN